MGKGSLKTKLLEMSLEEIQEAKRKIIIHTEGRHRVYGKIIEVQADYCIVEKELGEHTNDKFPFARIPIDNIDFIEDTKK